MKWNILIEFIKFIKSSDPAGAVVTAADAAGNTYRFRKFFDKELLTYPGAFCDEVIFPQGAIGLYKLSAS